MSGREFCCAIGNGTDSRFNMNDMHAFDQTQFKNQNDPELSGGISWTETGSLSRTNSRSSLGPDSVCPGSSSHMNPEEFSHKNFKFNLVKQLFGARRDSLASEQDTAIGDHSKCSSVSETESKTEKRAQRTSMTEERRISTDKSGCEQKTSSSYLNQRSSKRDKLDSQQDEVTEPSNSQQAFLKSETKLDRNCIREMCDEVSSRDVSSFRSWPLELRSRAAEWRIDPTVSSAPHSLALPRVLLLTRSPPPIPRTRRYCRQRSSGRETAASSTRRGGGASTRR